jgi:hypothetical protein
MADKQISNELFAIPNARTKSHTFANCILQVAKISREMDDACINF